MKKTVLIFGLIAGLIAAITLTVTLAICYNNQEFSMSMAVGFLSQFIAFSLIFVGIKNFRDKQNGGTITFGKAFKMGLFISLIASTIYVAAWVVQYYTIYPDFMDYLSAHQLNQLKESGASQDKIDNMMKEVGQMKEIYSTPIGVILATYVEILPTGILFSLIAALILKRKPKNEVTVV